MNFEIEFLPVGNGDSSGDAIVIRYGEDNNYKVMVVDGGTKESGEALVTHIKTHYNTNFVDFIVNTHPDQDHASGLSVVMESLEVGELWIHRPWNYTSVIIDYFKDQRMTEESLAKRLKEKFSASYSLEEIALKRRIPIKEPFQGQWIGHFHVMSPNINWYLHELIPDFNKTPIKKGLAESSFRDFIMEGIKSVFESMSFETLKEDGETSADNESSVILYAHFNEKGYMLTGDAGIKALSHANEYAKSKSLDLASTLRFIQIPHHGSRRNVSPSILNEILGSKGQEENKTAFVSAGEYAKKHPRQVVVNAFIRRGCKVISTEGNTIKHHHNMPKRDGWGPIEALKFNEEVEDYE